MATKRSDFSASNKILDLLKCDKHTKNDINRYCKDDDEVGCIKCMTENHGNCGEWHDIKEFVKNKPNIVPKFFREKENTQTELKSRRNAFHQELTGLEQNKKRVIADIKATQNKLINIIKKQTQDAIQKVEDKYDRIHNDLKVKVNDNEIDKIDRQLEDIGSASNNVRKDFVLSKKSKDVVAKAKQLNKDMKSETLGNVLTFELASLYKTVLESEISDLGNVTVTIPRLYSFSEKMTRKPPGYIWMNSCCTPDGSVFFTDNINNSIHHIDVKETLQLSSSPNAICCVSNSTIAVGLNKTIQMIDIEGKLKLTDDSTKVDHDICGLDYHDDIFYATSRNCVYKYDRNGKLLKSYSNIFSNIYNLVVNPLNKNIHVADYDNGVITMNQEGDVLNVVTDNIQGPRGICVDQNGQVLVSGFESKNIIQLSCDGRYIATVISKKLQGPQAICFDTRGRLYIGDMFNCAIEYKVEDVTE